MKRAWLNLILLTCLSQWTGAGEFDAIIQAYPTRLDNLFGALDGNNPELSSMRAMWNEGDREGALQSVVEHFRNPSFDVSLIAPSYIPYDYKERAEAALVNRFMIHGQWITVPAAGDGGIDWEYTGQAGDKEIAWMLNRHTILPMLAVAFQQTGETVYRNRLNKLLKDWITASPYPDRMTFSPQWRALEVARRILNSWIHIFHDHNELLEDETLLLMLGCLPDHADALYHHASFWGGNHLLTEKTALLALASAWPEFSAAPDWKNNAVNTISDQIMNQSYPDGSYAELSNHYQRVVINNTLPFLNLLRHAEADPGSIKGYNRIEAMWNYFACSMKPDGSGPLNNASDREYNKGYIEASWHHFDRRDWLGMATHGREGVLPTGSPSRLFPWAGHVFMRSDWGRSGHYVYFDAGPYGTAHQHVDRLHLSVSLNGDNLLVDSGRYSYKPGKWKDYFQGPRSHSIVLLDGHASDQGHRKAIRPADVHFQQLENLDYASASAVFNPPGEWLRSPVRWTRHVLFDKRGFVIVFDQLLAFKPRKVEVLWQFAPGITEQAARSIVTASGIKPSAQRAVLGREEVPAGGFFSPQYNHREAAVQLSHEYRIDRPTTLCHVIAPPGSPHLRVVYASDPATGLVELTVFERETPLAQGTLSMGNSPKVLAYRVQ